MPANRYQDENLLGSMHALGVAEEWETVSKNTLLQSRRHSPKGEKKCELHHHHIS